MRRSGRLSSPSAAPSHARAPARTTRATPLCSAGLQRLRRLQARRTHDPHVTRRMAAVRPFRRSGVHEQEKTGSSTGQLHRQRSAPKEPRSSFRSARATDGDCLAEAGECPPGVEVLDSGMASCLPYAGPPGPEHDRADPARYTSQASTQDSPATMSETRRSTEPRRSPPSSKMRRTAPIRRRPPWTLRSRPRRAALKANC